MDENNKFLITHFAPEELPSGGWRKLLFYTATEESMKEGLYQWGFSRKTATRDELARMVTSGSLIKLDMPRKANKGLGLWLDESGGVWLADIKNPFSTLENDRIKIT